MRHLIKLLAGGVIVIAAAVLSGPRPQAQTFSAPAGTVPAPDPKIPLYFEVATVKPAAPDAQGQSILRRPGGLLNATNMPLRSLIVFAYQIQDFQLVNAPGWLRDKRYDITARFEGGDPPAVIPGTGADHMMLALRTLLADRFKLKIRPETREMDIYALTMARPGGKPGAALKPASGDCSPEAFAARRGAPPPAAGTPPTVCGMQQGPGRIRFGGFPLSLFTRQISGRVGRTVVDRTGLTGNWDFELTFAATPAPGALPPGVEPPPVDPNAPDLFTAVQEQLGLKFEGAKGPVEVLIVDAVQEPTPD